MSSIDYVGRRFGSDPTEVSETGKEPGVVDRPVEMGVDMRTEVVGVDSWWSRLRSSLSVQ